MLTFFHKRWDFGIDTKTGYLGYQFSIFLGPLTLMICKRDAIWWLKFRERRYGAEH